MESPSFSTLSEAPLLSEDSGLIVTSGSISSDSTSGWQHIASELQESDYDEKSLSFNEFGETSERMCDDYFNTVKKGPGKAVIVSPIEPPPEFQDKPIIGDRDKCLADCEQVLDNKEITSTEHKTNAINNSTLRTNYSTSSHSTRSHSESLYEKRQCLGHRFTSPRLISLSPYRSNRPSSRNSFTSRLSNSHNSLVTQFGTDDSNFITQAISHDTLSAKVLDIIDMYNVPFDSDIYALPIDMVYPHSKCNAKYRSRRNFRAKKRVKRAAHGDAKNSQHRNPKFQDKNKNREAASKRYSLPSSCNNILDSDEDSVHRTFCEMKKYLQSFCSSSSDSDCVVNRNKKHCSAVHASKYSNREGTKYPKDKRDNPNIVENNNNHMKATVLSNAKSKHHRDKTTKNATTIGTNAIKETNIDRLKESTPNKKTKLSTVKLLSNNLKQGFCNLFRWKRHHADTCSDVEMIKASQPIAPAVVFHRALPPLPSDTNFRCKSTEEVVDFATSIQKVKDYGWYWGPISVETAEKILSSEPDGSFIVRDSSDDHYIFTLTFKLNGLRHVRIEHEQGNFCFGGCNMFKAQTIVEFIENAVETSRSGRYLFFLNLRPVLGPVRVQLLYPVSRFKRVQSLQHMSRFVILKHVRRDLISKLPLPRRLLDYLNATHYYSELLADM